MGPHHPQPRRLASDYASYMTGEVVSVSAQHP